MLINTVMIRVGVAVRISNRGLHGRFKYHFKSRRESK
jgi:hypothetical protein